MPNPEDNELFIGSMPDFELRVIPRWIFFNAQNGYKTPQFIRFTLENREDKMIAFRLRTKDRSLFLFSHRHGFLAPQASVTVTVLLTEADSWTQEVFMCINAIHKVIIENVVVNPNLKIPNCIEEQKKLSREIFKKTRQKTGNRGELNLYTKMRIVLPNNIE